ncbi:MAG: Holliday junction resolvase RuvX [Chloroflexi bacterium]|nr:Holliday junction resolvase RuvX [Chloroflexota bacterium]PKB56929.1 MAG: Holliday junction resolvase RuvX [SAR202 cluster bacterium Casp-Chloro-G3]
MGLDLGERRIGVSVSHGVSILVLPAGHLNRVKLKQDLERVLEMAEERQIEGIVVGLPYTLAGEVGVQAKRAQGFIRALRKRTSIPVFTIDETFTTFEAEGLLKEAGHEPSRNRGAVDSAAAVLILQRFLDEVSR